LIFLAIAIFLLWLFWALGGLTLDRLFFGGDFSTEKFDPSTVAQSEVSLANGLGSGEEGKKENPSGLKNSDERRPTTQKPWHVDPTRNAGERARELALNDIAEKKLERRGTLIGSLEGADESRIWGFAYDWETPSIPVEVWIYVDGVLVRDDVANGLREIGLSAPYDVQERGFSVESPDVIGDGREHTVRVLARIGRDDAFKELHGSPKIVGGNAPPEGAVVEFRAGKLIGWARDLDRPAQAVELEVLRDGKHLGSWQANGAAPTDVEISHLEARWFAVALRPEEEPYRVQVFALDPDQPGLRRELKGSPWTLSAPDSEEAEEEEEEKDKDKDKDEDKDKDKDKDDDEDEKNKLPYGLVAFIGIDQISGWAVDPDVPGVPIEVEVYFDGRLHGRILANAPFPALIHDPEIASINHLWLVNIPDELQDGETHTLSVFAVNLPLGANPELTGSPASFTGRRNTEPVGFLDYVNMQRAGGWAYDADAGADAVEVEVWIDGVFHALLWAGESRPDLVPVASREPYHGWSLPTVGILDDGEFHTVRAFVRDEPGGMLRELVGSPRELSPVKPWLGVSVGPGEDGRGLRVLSLVDGASASAAGVRVADRIVSHNGIETFADPEAFIQWIRSRSVGDPVHLVVERDEEGSIVERSLRPILGLEPSP